MRGLRPRRSEAVIRPLALLGGTFDPVHNAHLALARAALEQLGAEKLLWIPTGAPGYRRPPLAPASHRLAMLRLALAANAAFEIDERELAPGASGYTFDTLCSLEKDFPRHDLVLVMGADQYARRESWHRWPDLEKRCRIAVAARPDFPAPGGKAIQISFPTSAISASEIRARIGRGGDVTAMLPASVLGYLREHGLYR